MNESRGVSEGVGRSGVSDRFVRLYEDYYHGESKWRRLSAIDKADNILALCHAHPHEAILEIGAGEGSVLHALADRGFGREFFALEISQSGVSAISQRGIPRLARVELFDGYNVPYPDGRFDLVILSHVLEHVEHPRLILEEAARVGTLVFVEVPLEHTLLLSGDFLLDRIGHINFYAPVTIRRLLQSCSLEVVEQRVTCSSRAVFQYQMGTKGLLKYYVKKFVLKIAPRIATSLFTYHSILVCRKVA